MLRHFLAIRGGKIPADLLTGFRVGPEFANYVNFVLDFFDVLL